MKSIKKHLKIGLTLIIGLIIISTCIGSYFLFFNNKDVDNLEEPIVLDAKSLAMIKTAVNRINDQKAVDDNLLNELNNGGYTFNNPLVVVDPYNFSPLTALIIFKTDNPANIKIHITGKDAISNVDFTFDDYQKEHMIPVYGLYSDTANKITLTAEDQNSNIEEQTLNIQTEPLSNELIKSDINIKTNIPSEYEPGFNFTYEGKKSAFDNNGDFRWFLSDFNFLRAGLYNYNGNYILAEGAYTIAGPTIFYEINPLGKIYNIYYSDYGVHHDIEEMDNGNLLITGNSKDQSTFLDFLYELNTSNGKIDNTLSLTNVLQTNRQVPLTGKNDWVHVNAAVPLNNNEILVSCKNQSAIVKLSFPDGKIDWILSNPLNWSDKYQPYLLQPVGDNFNYAYAQHSPVMLSNSNLLIFDNGLSRDQYLDANTNISPHSSRLVEYQIDEKNKTVKQVWEYGGDLGYFTSDRGAVNILPNNNKLAIFNNGLKTYLIEINNDDNVVWQAEIASTSGIASEYRLDRMEIYNQNANDLKIGTTANNYIPKNILNEVK